MSANKRETLENKFFTVSIVTMEYSFAPRVLLFDITLGPLHRGFPKASTHSRIRRDEGVDCIAVFSRLSAPWPSKSSGSVRQAYSEVIDERRG